MIMRFGVGAFRRMYETIKHGIRAKPVLRHQAVAGVASGLVRGLPRGRFAAGNRLQFRDAFRVQCAVAGSVDVDVVAQGIQGALRET